MSTSLVVLLPLMVDSDFLSAIKNLTGQRRVTSTAVVSEVVVECNSGD